MEKYLFLLISIGLVFLTIGTLLWFFFALTYSFENYDIGYEKDRTMTQNFQTNMGNDFAYKIAGIPLLGCFVGSIVITVWTYHKITIESVTITIVIIGILLYIVSSIIIPKLVRLFTSKAYEKYKATVGPKSFKGHYTGKDEKFLYGLLMYLGITHMITIVIMELIINR